VLSVVTRASANLDKPPQIVRRQAARLPWAWDGLVFAVPFNSADYLGLRDVVNEVGPSVVSNVAWTRDNRGNIACTLSASAYLEYADHPRHDTPTNELTVYARFMRVGAGDVWGGIFVNVWGVGSPYTTWGLDDNAAGDGHINATVVAPTSGDFHQSADTGTVMSSTEYMSAFIRWRTVNAHTLHVLGERGQAVVNVTDDEVTTGPLLYAAGKPIRINGTEHDPPDSFNAKYSQCMVWKRRLGDAEMAALVADPYGWCSPRRETISVAAPFPVGPGFASSLMQFIGPTQS